MVVSVFDLFSIGIGPSSSHTVGPMRDAARFAAMLVDTGVLARAARVRVELYGSLAATGRGHGTLDAVVLGLEANAPETVDPGYVTSRAAEISETRRLRLAGGHEIDFDVPADIVAVLQPLDFHSNGMVFTAIDSAGEVLAQRTYFSVGGGFVVDEEEAVGDASSPRRPTGPPA